MLDGSEQPQPRYIDTTIYEAGKEKISEQADGCAYQPLPPLRRQRTVGPNDNHQ